MNKFDYPLLKTARLQLRLLTLEDGPAELEKLNFHRNKAKDKGSEIYFYENIL